MENLNTENSKGRVKWGVKLRHEPEAQYFEVKITLPVGDEDSLPALLEEKVIQAFPEMLRALQSGRLPGNELDLTNR